METGIEFKMADEAACGCCHVGMDTSGETTCAERSRIFTDREMEVLLRIREHRERAQELRKQIGQSNGHPESLSLRKSALEELDRLRSERALLEEERLAAAEERMRLLGHA
jgi:TolA-binding protein